VLVAHQLGAAAAAGSGRRSSGRSSPRPRPCPGTSRTRIPCFSSHASRATSFSRWGPS